MTLERLYKTSARKRIESLSTKPLKSRVKFSFQHSCKK